jgi:DNA adenine methylase
MPSNKVEVQETVPFLRWAGGKRRLVPLLLDALPPKLNFDKARYFEPFLGGAAFALAISSSHRVASIRSRNLILNDTNPDLVLTYKSIRDDLDALLKGIKKLAVNLDKEEFEKIKKYRPKNDVMRAARFLYLNSRGDFNVPFGKLKNPTIYTEENLRLVSIQLRDALITNLDFTKSVAKAKKGDLVYFDPPYIPLNPTSAFAQYAKEGFGIDKQKLLATTIKELVEKGVFVILSNSDTQLTKDIFGDVLDLYQVSVARSIGANSESRIRVNELIGLGYEPNSGSSINKYRLVK